MKWIKNLVYLFFMGFAMHIFLSMMGLSWLHLFDLPSLLLVLAGWLLILGTYSLSEICRAFAQALGLGQTEQSAALSLQIMNSLAQYGLFAGGVCTLLGVVQALGNLSDLPALGAALALSLLGLFYGLFASLLIFLPLQKILAQQALASEVSL